MLKTVTRSWFILQSSWIATWSRFRRIFQPTPSSPISNQLNEVCRKHTTIIMGGFNYISQQCPNFLVCGGERWFCVSGRRTHKHTLFHLHKWQAFTPSTHTNGALHVNMSAYCLHKWSCERAHHLHSLVLNGPQPTSGTWPGDWWPLT